MTDAEYSADPCMPLSLRGSLCKTLIAKSPLHAYCEHPKLGRMDDDEESDDQSGVKAFGSIVHSLILGRGKKVVVSPFKTFQSNDAKVWKAQQIEAGHLIAKQEQIDRAQFIRDSVRQALDRLGFGHAFVGPEGIEQVIAWKEKDFWLRAMLDHWHGSTAEIFDIKTCESAHPKAIESACYNYGYDIQEQFAKRGIAALRPELNGRTTFRFVFVETQKPYACQVIELDGEAQTIGASRMMRAIDTWKRCLASNQWPAYSNEILRISPPKWALAVEMGAPVN
jgi:hypothetical protein